MEDKNMDEKKEDEETVPLMINWDPEVCTLFTKQVNSKLLNEEQTLEVPSWITNAISQDGKVREGMFRTGIVEFLKEAGGTRNSFGSVLILGITKVQFSKVISAATLIENDPFMQDVMRDVLRKIAEEAASNDECRLGSCLASLALLTHNKEERLYGEPIGALPVAKNNVNLFSECKYDSQISMVYFSLLKNFYLIFFRSFVLKHFRSL